MSRQLLMKAGLGICALTAAAAAARYSVLSPPPRRDGASMDELAAEIHADLSTSAGARACLDYDHPLRQMHNRGLWLGGLTVNAATLSWKARRALTTILYFADYDVDFEGGRHAGDNPSQIFRLEGPGAVFHFRGEPHVHAFTSIERNADQPLSLGEVVGMNPVALEGESLRAWLESAMLRHTEADYADYPSFSVAGRLRAGSDGRRHRAGPS